jgi:hypothetical protein
MRVRESFTIAPHTILASHHRSYACDVLNASNNDTQVPNIAVMEIGIDTCDRILLLSAMPITIAYTAIAIMSNFIVLIKNRIDIFLFRSIAYSLVKKAY